MADNNLENITEYCEVLEREVTIIHNPEALDKYKVECTYSGPGGFCSNALCNERLCRPYAKIPKTPSTDLPFDLSDVKNSDILLSHMSSDCFPPTPKPSNFWDKSKQTSSDSEEATAVSSEIMAGSGGFRGYQFGI